MAEIKPFFKKYEKHIVIAVTLLIIYIILVFNQKINFILGNELIVYLEPSQKSFSMHYGDSTKIDFSISIDNFAQCRAICNYSFHDRSTNELIDKSSFIVGKGDLVEKSYELIAKRKSGQDLYSFDLSCRSIPSAFCLTKSPEKFRSSLVIVNYDLTKEEKELRKDLKYKVEQLLKALADVDVEHQKANQKYFELARKVNLKNITKQKILFDDKLDKVRIYAESLKSFWSVDDYLKLNKSFDPSYFLVLSEVNESIKNFSSDIDGIVSFHNEFLSVLSSMRSSLEWLQSSISLLEYENATKHFIPLIDNFNYLSSSIESNTFEDYGAVIDKIANMHIQQERVINETRLAAAEFLFAINYYLKFEEDFMCLLKGNCSSTLDFGDALTKAKTLMKIYPNISSIRGGCNALLELNNTYTKTRFNFSNIIAEKNLSFSSDQQFLDMANNYSNALLAFINSSYFDFFTGIANTTSREIIKISEQYIPKNRRQAQVFNLSENLSLYLLSKINLQEKTSASLEKCPKLNEPIYPTTQIDFSPIIINITYNTTSIDGTLPDNPPVCCVLGDCGPCCNDESCKNDPKSFPVILLHGHSIAKDNSPEFSLDSFNKLQSKLQEDGYLNAGTVSLYSKNEKVQPGLWGFSGKPITVKVSYYYDAFLKDDKYIVIPTKSENIDTYAIRLKDLIELTKERTGKPKVNVIAYSMGGLVARRYLQIFGSQDVDKLIMVGTPNKGISGSVASYCGLVGENRECKDMLKDSLFINKLNEQSKQPSNVKMYSIIGMGCKMNGEDGDGLVTASSAKLDNASLFYVNGTCSVGSLLHTNLLAIDKYPEVYNLIVKILKE